MIDETGDKQVLYNPVVYLSVVYFALVTLKMTALDNAQQHWTATSWKTRWLNLPDDYLICSSIVLFTLSLIPKGSAVDFLLIQMCLSHLHFDFNK